MNEPLVIGVDPGSTSAVAAYNLEKELVLLESGREMAGHEIIRKVIERGTPVLVGCDTADMPDSVSDIASSLGARKFSPEDDLRKSRKEELGDRGDNSHEKDAAAAALHAFNSNKKKIRKINRQSDDTEDRARLARKRFRQGIRKADI